MVSLTLKLKRERDTFFRHILEKLLFSEAVFALEELPAPSSLPIAHWKLPPQKNCLFLPWLLLLLKFKLKFVFLLLLLLQYILKVFEVVATLDDNISTVLFEVTVWKIAATLSQNVSEKVWEELRRFPNGEGECSWTRQDKKQQNVCSTNWETERSEKAADSFCWFAAFFFFFFFGNLQLKWPSSLAVVDRHWPWPRTSTSTTSTASASSTTSTTTYHHRRRQNGGDGGGSGGRHYSKLFVVDYKIAPPSTVIDLSLPPMYLTVQVCVCMSSKPQHFIHTHLFASTSIFGSFLVPFKRADSDSEVVKSTVLEV